MMRVIAKSVLVRFYETHAETRAAIERWHSITKKATWSSPQDVISAFPKAKALNRERVRFEILGGNYRMVVAFDFKRQAAFIKFIGTHAEYDAIDALTVSQF